MMIIIFWEMTPCGSYKNRRFGGSYRLHLQDVRVQASTERVVSSYDIIGVAVYTRVYHSLCLLVLVHPEDGGDTILRTVGSYKSHTVSSPRR
jgi:hypothetical protein